MTEDTNEKEMLDRLLSLQPFGDLSNVVTIFDNAFMELNKMSTDLENFKDKNPTHPNIGKMEARYKVLKEANELFRTQAFALDYYRMKFINTEMELMSKTVAYNKLKDKFDRLTLLKEV